MRSSWWWRWAKAAGTCRLARAQDLVFGYAVGLDMTRRDLQMDAKKLGRPWDMGKGFDQSAPCAPLSRASEPGRSPRVRSR